MQAQFSCFKVRCVKCSELPWICLNFNSEQFQSVQNQIVYLSTILLLRPKLLGYTSVPQDLRFCQRLSRNLCLWGDEKKKSLLAGKGQVNYSQYGNPQTKYNPKVPFAVISEDGICTISSVRVWVCV